MGGSIPNRNTIECHSSPDNPEGLGHWQRGDKAAAPKMGHTPSAKPALGEQVTSRLCGVCHRPLHLGKCNAWWENWVAPQSC